MCSSEKETRSAAEITRLPRQLVHGIAADPCGGGARSLDAQLHPHQLAHHVPRPHFRRVRHRRVPQHPGSPPPLRRAVLQTRWSERHICVDKMGCTSHLCGRDRVKIKVLALIMCVIVGFLNILVPPPRPSSFPLGVGEAICCTRALWSKTVDRFEARSVST